MNEYTRPGMVLPVANTVILPGVETAIRLGKAEQKYLAAIQHSSAILIALPVKSHIGEQLKEEDFHRTGVIFTIRSLSTDADDMTLLMHTEDRVLIHGMFLQPDAIRAEYDQLPDAPDLDERSRAEMLGYLKKAVRQISAHFQGGEQFSQAADQYQDINALIVYLSHFMQLSETEQYALLKTGSLKERSLLFIDCLMRQKNAVELNMQINEKFSEKANQMYRDQALRAQLKAIQDELNENSGAAKDAGGKKDYRRLIEESGMPEEVRQTILEEASHLDTSAPDNYEQSILRNYLDFALALPWKKETEEPFDLKKARAILDEDHYGLEKVKERIIEHLAVMQLNKKKQGSVLLLVGAPGTGKTSLGRSIAKALGRKYIRMSLGGIRDEAEIRGHRRTYVGAMPGRILESIRRAGTSNPVMVLDEVDKLMPGGFSGDPASALLEVLDPEQNSSFTDHYLNLPYDLSDVFFLATANSLESIPAPLLDRMEIIQISGYTPDEKFHIAKEHLLPEVLNENGIQPEQLQIPDSVLQDIIENYTLEAGVRGLKKQLAAIARAASVTIVSGQEKLPYRVAQKDLDALLGHQVSMHEKAQSDNPAGVVTGLAWTPVGGEILFIETTEMPGTGEVILTGQLGDVMKESARISLSVLKSRLPLNTMNFKDKDFHIHVPSGAVQKDGPSAGIALFAALASLITGIKVDPHLALTGEITLRGQVMPIGGLKEKLLGAQRAGITKVLIPKDNESDLREIPQEIRQQITIVPVETVEDVLRETIGISLPRIDHTLLLSDIPSPLDPNIRHSQF